VGKGGIGIPPYGSWFFPHPRPFPRRGKGEKQVVEGEVHFGSASEGKGGRHFWGISWNR